MKHLFILNSSSLKKKSKKNRIISLIKKECIALDYEIYFTKSAHDMKKKVVSEAAKDADICIYVGGGDGTLHLVAEAVYKYKNVTLSAIPLGRGNDFVRSFGGKKRFLELEHIKNGVTEKIDIIKINDRICINMINIGFDESVVRRAEQLKRFSFITNAFAYTIGVLIQLISFPHEELEIILDGKSNFKGKFLLTFAANGQYCGGGYRAASEARIDDGIIDVMIIYPMSRLSFVRLVGYYRNGTLIGGDREGTLFEFHKAKNIVAKKDRPFHVCIDGEILQFASLDIKVLPQAIKFKYPK